MKYTSKPMNFCAKTTSWFIRGFFAFCIGVVGSSFVRAESINSTYYAAYEVATTTYYFGTPVVTTKVYFVNKESILLLHGDVITPVTFMPDMPTYVLDQADQVLTNPDIHVTNLNENTIYDEFPLPENTITLLDSAQLFSGDFNGDGQSDLVVSYGGSIQIISVTNGVASLYAQFVPPSGYQISGVADYDQDGLADIKITYQGQQYVFSNDGPNNFIAETAVSGLDTSLIGSTAGAFRVNEQGAATYSIPIMTFAGTAGVVPQVGLNYSSQGGSGIAGIGWSIGGISAVSRCRQTESQDGNVDSLSFSAGDRFCLDGQRLILTSGSYGGVGSTYRTEIDSHVEVTSMGGSLGHPEYFKVTGKDGSTRYYGQSLDSKQVVSSSRLGTGTLSWNINQFEDNIGNPIKFSYLNDDNGLRISHIYYAFGQNTSVSTSDTYIEFLYELRPDVRRDFDKQLVNQRLSQIKSFNSGVELRNYQLHYLGLLPTNTPQTAYVAADRSYLQQITECIGSQCLKPTKFNWHATSGGSIDAVADFTYTYTTQSDRVASWKPIDINGDGIGDLVWVVGDYDDDGDVHDNFVYSMLGKAGGVGYDAPKMVYQRLLKHSDNSAPMQIHVLDYNADGRQDIALWDYSSWKILLSKVQVGGGWALEDTSASIDTGIAVRDVTFADLNSDGLIDVAYNELPAPTPGEIYVRKLTLGTNLASEQAYSFGPPQALLLSDPNLRRLANNEVGDFDGDGRVEIVIRRYEYSIYDFDVHIFTHRSYNVNLDNLTIEEANQIGGASQTRLIADLDSNALSDWFYTSTAGNENRIWSYTIDGSWVLGYSRITKEFGTIHEDVTPQFVDYNRDGYIDIAWHHVDGQNSALKVRHWNPTTESYDAAQIIRSTDDDTKKSHLLMDINGDGALDYVLAENNKVTVYHGQALDVDGTIASIDNGMGNETLIEYERLNTASEHYAALDNRVEHEETTTTQTQCGGGQYGVPSLCFDQNITTANAAAYYTALNSGWSLDFADIDTKYNVTSQYEAPASPVLEFAAPINLVKRVSSSAPDGTNHSAKSHIGYFYTEAKIQAAGRGLLGFRTIATKDEQSQVVTTTRYRQDFPFIGSPLYTSVMAPTNEQATEYQLVKESFNDYGFVSFSDTNPASKRYQVWARNVIETSYDLNGVETSHTKTASAQPDSWGNVTSITASTFSAADHTNYLTQTETSSVYTGDADDQRFGRISSSTVTHRRAGEPPVTKSSSFTYYTAGIYNNLLHTETVDASGVGAQSVTTTYEYDDDGLGNKKRATTSTAGETSRTVEWDYSSDGRYLETTTNGLGQLTEQIPVSNRNEYGSPTEIQGVNGYIADITTDLLGRETYRIDSTGAWQQTTYSTSGLVSGASYKITTDVAGGGTATEYFDVLGRSMAKTSVGFDGLTVWSKTEYDSSGRIKRQSLPYRIGETILWSVNTYDVLGRVDLQTLPDTTIVDFDYNGLQTTVTNALTQTKTEIRNAAGELVEVIDAGGLDAGRVVNTYTADGQLKTASVIADGKTITAELTYNGHGQKIKMFDPDKGTWFYAYNGFGELADQYKVTSTVKYTGNLASLAASAYQRTHMIYDVLGRMTQRNDYIESNVLEGTSTWTYDTAANGIGRLHTESGGGLTKTYSYGAYTDPQRTDIVTYTGGVVAVMSTTYDNIGRPIEQTDAVGLGSGTQSNYNSYGYLDTVVDSETGLTVYDVVDTDAQGNVIDAILQDGVTVTRTYNPSTGRINTIRAVTALGVDVQNLDYSWDAIGNLTSRDDIKNGQAQSFCYDALNRLTKTHSALSGSCSLTPAQQDVEYDGFGNITRKAGLGIYTYSTDMTLRPHAVITADSVTYTYDNNGNVTGDTSGRTFTYASFDKPTQITKGTTYQIDFNYGADRSRWKRVDTDNTTSTTKVTTTYYLGGVEKVVSSSGTRYKRTIAGVAIWTHDNSGALLEQSTLYKDALGSIVATRLMSNGVVSDMAFNPWGERVVANDLVDILEGTELTPFLDLSGLVTTRGFTGHEMLDGVGVVHMNGRIYDARLGRFLQADPFVDGVSNTQGYNRYSYGHNNPLNGTDPSGYGFYKEFFDDFLGVTENVVLSTFTQILACTNPYSCIGYSMAQGYEYGGGLAGALKQGVIAGVSYLAFTGIGETFDGSTAFLTKHGLGHIGAHALAGGIMAELQGGKFGHGFFSAGLTKGLTPHFTDIGGDAFNIVDINVLEATIAGIIGGTASKVTGGKFANGAITAAMGNMYNQQRSGNIQKDPHYELKVKFGEKVRAALRTDGEYKIDIDVTEKLKFHHNSETGEFVGAYGATEITFSDSGLEALSGSLGGSSLVVDNFNDLAFDMTFNTPKLQPFGVTLWRSQKFTTTFDFKNSTPYSNNYNRNHKSRIYMEENGI